MEVCMRNDGDDTVIDGSGRPTLSALWRVDMVCARSG